MIGSNKVMAVALCARRLVNRMIGLSDERFGVERFVGAGDANARP
jgi:hypothetical protein